VSDERCSLRLTRRFDAPIGEVWRAIADDDARTRWLGIDHTAREREPGTMLELDLPSGVARIELHADGDATVLVLEQTDMPAAQGMRAMRTWTVAVERLEVAL
jgi:hypothetical protein